MLGKNEDFKMIYQSDLTPEEVKELNKMRKGLNKEEIRKLVEIEMEEGHHKYLYRAKEVVAERIGMNPLTLDNLYYQKGKTITPEERPKTISSLKPKLEEYYIKFLKIAKEIIEDDELSPEEKVRILGRVF